MGNVGASLDSVDDILRQVAETQTQLAEECLPALAQLAPLFSFLTETVRNGLAHASYLPSMIGGADHILDPLLQTLMFGSPTFLIHQDSRE